MVIGVGTNVPFDFKGLTSHLLNFLMVSFLLAA